MKHKNKQNLKFFIPSLLGGVNLKKKLFKKEKRNNYIYLSNWRNNLIKKWHQWNWCPLDFLLYIFESINNQASSNGMILLFNLFIACYHDMFLNFIRRASLSLSLTQNTRCSSCANILSAKLLFTVYNFYIVWRIKPNYYVN